MMTVRYPPHGLTMAMTSTPLELDRSFDTLDSFISSDSIQFILTLILLQCLHDPELHLKIYMNLLNLRTYQQQL